MAKVEERLKAEALRRQGWSIAAIARKVNVSKSSASNWCWNIKLTPKQKRVLIKRWEVGGHRGRILGSATNHRRKMERILHYIQEGKKDVQALSPRELLLVGTAIYWGEGSKKSQLAFINSDKDMILFVYRWFQVALGVKKEDFIATIFINALHKGRHAIIKKYWSSLLNLPHDQFRKTIFINRPNTKKYSNHDTYFGLLSLRVRRSAELKYKILGLIEGLKYSKF